LEPVVAMALVTRLLPAVSVMVPPMPVMARLERLSLGPTM
jgi:hypothetical protein